MSRRQRFQIALLFLLPVVVNLIIHIRYHDSYIAITASYIVLLVILQFVAIDDFLRFPDLQELWGVHALSVGRFVYEAAQCQILLTESEDQPLCIIIAQPRIVLSNPHLYNVSKLRHAVDETGTFISSMRDEFTYLTFINILLLVALMILSNPTPISGSTEELLRAQGKLLFSYFAVVVQLVWLVRIPFHYRQKNAEIYSQLIATSSTPVVPHVP